MSARNPFTLMYAVINRDVGRLSRIAKTYAILESRYWRAFMEQRTALAEAVWEREHARKQVVDDVLAGMIAQ